MSTPPVSREPEALRPPDPHRRRALVVEDDAGIRALVGAVLRRQGYGVDAVGDGERGLTAAESGVYEIIVLDLMLPRLHGLDVIERLRESCPATLRRIVVITASVHLMRGNVPEDVCRVIAKPFDLSSFEAAVADCTATS